jgi:hypothetical protein
MVGKLVADGDTHLLEVYTLLLLTLDKQVKEFFMEDNLENRINKKRWCKNTIFFIKNKLKQNGV